VAVAVIQLVVGVDGEVAAAVFADGVGAGADHGVDGVFIGALGARQVELGAFQGDEVVGHYAVTSWRRVMKPSAKVALLPASSRRTYRTERRRARPLVSAEAMATLNWPRPASVMVMPAPTDLANCDVPPSLSRTVKVMVQPVMSWAGCMVK